MEGGEIMNIEIVVSNTPVAVAGLIMSGGFVDAVVDTIGIPGARWTFVGLWLLSIQVVFHALWGIAHRVVGSLHRRGMVRRAIPRTPVALLPKKGN